MRVALLALWLAACAGPGPPPVRLEAVGVGIASRMNGEGARTGITFAYWESGWRGWGSFAKLRLDAVMGLDILFYDDEDDLDTRDRDKDLGDDHVGAIVFDMGLVYRMTDHLAVYGGVGLGDKYEYEVRETSDGGQESSLHSLKFGGNATAGLLWLWGSSGAGMDFGYDTFDRSWRFGLVVNYGGRREPAPFGF